MNQKRARPDPVARVRDPSFIPARADFGALLEALGRDDAETDEEAIERALARAGEPVADAAMAKFSASKPPLRGRLVRVVGRVAKSEPHVAWLVDRLEDEDAKTRRNAIVALGKHPSAEGSLVDRWSREDRIEHRRSIAASLGKIGGPRALALLSNLETDDAELRRIAAEAKLKVERTTAREEPSSIDPDAPIDTVVRFRCRSGIERILDAELGDRAQVAGPTAVDLHLRGPLSSAFRARTALRFGFPLPVPKEGSVESRVASAIAHPRTVALLTSLTRGTVRYRIEWASAGHRRAATFKVASEVATRAPALRNDPTKSLWEIVVEQHGERLDVEAWPKGLADTRFDYRVAEVPGASHPTLAAALAQVAGVRREEVIWDPYVGGGTELIERARLGAYASIYGSDIDPRAVDAARKNLEQAGVRALVIEADARSSRPPEKLSLVITNPPMGRRVLDRASLEPLFEGLLANVAPALRRDGRIVWYCPIFDRIVPIAAKNKLRVDRRGAVDMGGFEAELQVLEPRR